jgi:hypothetical protein
MEKIKLNEEQLRNFISYSVKRILKEGYGHLPTFELELDPETDDELMESIEKAHKNFNDVDAQLLDSIWPLYIEVEYDYDAPGDPGYNGYINLTDWKLEDNQNIPEEIAPFVTEVIKDYVYYTGNEFIKDKIIDSIDYEHNNYYDGEDDALREENLGITTHFETDPNDKPRNPYEGMTWEEYCEAKKKEREEENKRFAKEKHEKMEPNLGITTHFETKTPPKDEEPIRLDKDELKEMILKAINEVLKK